MRNAIAISLALALGGCAGTVALPIGKNAFCQPTLNGKPTALDLTDCIRDGCRQIVRPITDAIAQLIASFDPEFQHRLKNNVLLAGGGSLIGGLDLAIEIDMHERLGGGKVMRIDEPTYGGANGALKIAQDMPAEFWKKLR